MGIGGYVAMSCACAHTLIKTYCFSILVSEKRIIDMEYHLPFLCFSVENILLLLSCILTQQRIIFLASNYSLLTPITEVGSRTADTRELRSTTRAAQRRGLNFSARMSVKQFHYCNKCLKIFQITLRTAKFD